MFHIYGARIAEGVSHERSDYFYEFRDRGMACRAFVGARVCVPRDKTMPYIQG